MDVVNNYTIAIISTAMQSQMAVSAYFTSGQKLPFCFAEQSRCPPTVKCVVICNLLKQLTLLLLPPPHPDTIYV